jgi:hypothetical protein
MTFLKIIILFFLALKQAELSHFRGGHMSWSPLNFFDNNSIVEIQITTNFYYRYSVFNCNTPLDIAAGNLVGDGYLIKSLNGPSWSISADVFCNSYNIPFQWQSGNRTQKVNVTAAYPITASFSGW